MVNKNFEDVQTKHKQIRTHFFYEELNNRRPIWLQRSSRVSVLRNVV